MAPMRIDLQVAGYAHTFGLNVRKGAIGIIAGDSWIGVNGLAVLLNLPKRRGV